MIDAVTIAMAGFVPNDGGKYWADIVEEDEAALPLRSTPEGVEAALPLRSTPEGVEAPYIPMYIKYVDIATMTYAYTKTVVIPGIGVFSKNPYSGKSDNLSSLIAAMYIN